jgi:hypothetical protein
MLFLLVVSVLGAVALVHRYLQIYAPTNVLARRVRGSAATFRASGLPLACALTMLLLMHLLAESIGRGAPAWLNLLVFVLAWDVIKLGLLALHTSVRSVAVVFRRVALGARYSPRDRDDSGRVLT